MDNINEFEQTLNDFDNLTINDTHTVYNDINDCNTTKYNEHHHKYKKFIKCKKIYIKGDKGDQGPIGLTGEKGDKGDVGQMGPIGLTGEKGDQGPIGLSGEKGDIGQMGPQGEVGQMGPQGEVGPMGLTGEVGPMGLTGEMGLPGFPGEMGPIGPQGIQGEIGPMGPPGQVVGNDSIYLWSINNQNNRDVTRYQYIEFEALISNNPSWSLNVEPGYSNYTTFVAQITGYYMISYKVDVKAGNGNPPSGVTNCSTVLIRNNNALDGSMTIVEAPETNHVYTLSNTILINVNQGDYLSLLFWGNDQNTRIGYRERTPGILPNGQIPIESTASIIIIRLS